MPLMKLSGLWPVILYHLVRTLYEEFKVYTDARNFHSGEIISQKGKPIVLNDERLTDTHIRYIATEKEMLRFVESINEFRTKLRCQKLRIYTDHKNLTHNNLILIEC